MPKNILHNDKFQNIINREGIDLILTDPPYNIGFKYPNYDDNLSDQDYIDMIKLFKGFKSAIIQYPEETMRYVVPALGVPDKVITWCYNANYNIKMAGKRYYHFHRLISIYNTYPDFTRVKQPYKNLKDKRIQARMAAGSEGTNLYDWFSDIQIVKNVSKEKTIHPCPIPEKLIERLILLLTNEGDTIFDPFMGCGTVPYVAKKLNRNYIGCEIDKTYFDVAVKRVASI
jgi:DNA modification methylase